MSNLTTKQSFLELILAVLLTKPTQQTLTTWEFIENPQQYPQEIFASYLDFTVFFKGSLLGHGWKATTTLFPFPLAMHLLNAGWIGGKVHELKDLLIFVFKMLMNWLIP